MEELQVEARLERKKKALVLRQRREAKRQLDGLDKKRKEQEKLAARCREMQREDEASSQMMIWFLAEEARERADKKREEDDRCYREIAAVCRQAKCLGVARSTSGATGIQRLQLLQDRIATKETELKRSEEAKSRLDALQSKRPKVTAEMRRFFASSVRRKMEKAIASRDCEHFLHLLEPRHSETQDLLNLESSNGLTPALSAIFTGNLSVLRRLLELGASVEMESSDGMTPLLAAIMTDDIVAMNMLTEFRVDLNSETRNGVTPLLLAADKGRLRALRFLLDSGADVDRVNQTSTSALMQACVSGHYDAVRILLAYGARKDLRDTNSRSAVDCAGRYKYVSILFLLRGLVDSESLMTQLKADDADTETHGHTSPSMDRTARRDRFCIVDQLLNDRNLERLRLLLSAEDSMVSPNYETANGISPLILFCSLGTCSDVLFCLERKCIPTHQNRDGVTALITACKRGDGGMIELLLKYGCSLLTRDFSGRDGFHYLNSNDHPEVAERMTKIHRNAVSVSPQLGLGTPVMAAKSMKAECGDDPRHEIVLTSVRLASEIGRTPELSSPTDRSEHDSDSDDPILDPRIRRWGTRQSVLKRNRHKRQQFNDERERILAAACRGRRNGLIAPLPGDPNGTSKYPVCNHCKEIRARKRCLNCELVLCDKCHARLHEIAHRRHHEYEEVLPEMHDSQKDRCQDHQEEQHSLGHLVCQSRQCVASVYGILNVDLPHHQHANADPEVDKYEAHVRIKREKEMIQKQINVPVAAAHHAAAANEGEIFARPAEFDLAILYMTQKKFDKARELLSRAQRIVQEAVGARHPSMLKVAVAMAKIERDTGHSEVCTDAIETSMALFESVVAADHDDFIDAVGVLLSSLEQQHRYADAVKACRRFRDRCRIELQPAHPLVNKMNCHLDVLISKREGEQMTAEDELVSAKSRRRAEQEQEIAQIKELRIANCRRLLLSDNEESTAFFEFARAEFATDLIQFWIAVEECNQSYLDAKAFRARVVHIFITHIKSKRVKVITAAQRKNIKKIITAAGKTLPTTVFNEVQAIVFDFIYNGVYSRYLGSRQ